MANLLRNALTKCPRNILIQPLRPFSRSAVRCEEFTKVVGVSEFNKKLLVWAGKYKTIQEVPNLLPPDVIDRAKSRLRIRTANIMIALTIVGCFVMVYSGKKARAAGDSLQKRQEDYIKKLKEESRIEAEQAAK